jgi:hypothetical protein
MTVISEFRTCGRNSSVGTTTVRPSNPGSGIFRIVPDRSWGPPGLKWVGSGGYHRLEWNCGLHGLLSGFTARVLETEKGGNAVIGRTERDRKCAALRVPNQSPLVLLVKVRLRQG